MTTAPGSTAAPARRCNDRQFSSSVFIATSLDGFIARTDGDIDWLTSRGEQAGDTGYQDRTGTADTAAGGAAARWDCPEIDGVGSSPSARSSQGTADSL